MGNSSSKKGKSKPAEQRIQSLGDTKHVVLVHHSTTKKDKKLVRYFKDVLVEAAPSKINIEKTFNLGEGSANLYDVSWLGDLNNIILIRLTLDGVDIINNVARNKKYIDENNRFHARVFSVAFGSSLPDGWPPVNVGRESADQRDFCLGKDSEDDDFDEKKIASLVSAIAAS